MWLQLLSIYLPPPRTPKQWNLRRGSWHLCVDGWVHVQFHVWVIHAVNLDCPGQLVIRRNAPTFERNVLI
jgi:hypothetical protein